jgi:hypothetical protein
MNCDEAASNLPEKISAFLNEIGIPCRQGTVPAETLLPGIFLERGQLTYDAKRLAYPGDLLHEAGHIATTAPSLRSDMTGNLDVGAGNEMASIAWLFAAGFHLGLEPEVVFHADG